MRRVISGGNGVARGALWAALALAAFFLADALLFRTGWYNAYLEPDSAAGSLESHLYWVENIPPGKAPEVLVVGDSRIAEGFSSRTATAETNHRLRFWNLGVAGTTPRVWYYSLRDLDPTRRRFAAIVIAMERYSDVDWLTTAEERVSDQKYLTMRLSLSDCFGFAASVHTFSLRDRALFGCFFRGMMLREDVQTFLAAPNARMKRAADWLENGLVYDSGYGGMTESLAGLSADWRSRTLHFPEGISPARRGNVESFVMPEPVVNAGVVARYRREWFGRILDLYKDSPTRIVFLQLPRAPLVDPNTPTETSGRFVDSAQGRPRVVVLPAETFTSLEQPDLFGDGLHLNHNGRPLFSVRLAERMDAVLNGGGK